MTVNTESKQRQRHTTDGCRQRVPVVLVVVSLLSAFSMISVCVVAVVITIVVSADFLTGTFAGVGGKQNARFECLRAANTRIVWLLVAI